jgi:hypothetical protein
MDGSRAARRPGFKPHRKTPQADTRGAHATQAANADERCILLPSRL